jgi:hypothetical protein
LYGNRTIHFEFLNCLSISKTKYRSECRIVGEKEKSSPEDAAKKGIEQLTGIRFDGKDVQQKLL